MRRALPLLALLLLPAVAALPMPDDAPPISNTNTPCWVESHKRFLFDYLGYVQWDSLGNPEWTNCRLYQKTGVHFVVVLVPSTEGDTIDAYATRLFNAWGIGDKDRNDGLLVLYAADDGSGSGAVRVEVGYGLEATVNAQVARDAVEAMQRAKQQALAEGDAPGNATLRALDAGAGQLAAFLIDHYDGQGFQPAAATTGGWQVPVTFAAVFLALFCSTLAWMVWGARKGAPGGGIRDDPIGPTSSDGSGTGSGHDSHSGGDFGGGHSGGGGASGKL